MTKIIKKQLLENEKSTFEIRLIENANGLNYIELEQKIHPKKEIESTQTIKINPAILSEIIEVLSEYKDETHTNKLSKPKRFTLEDEKKIQHHYLKGTAIQNLALMYNCSEKIIENILMDSGVEIVSQEVPKYYRRRFRPKK